MDQRRTFIIAECGINHNGDIELAKKLISAAKWADADAVKFQKRTIDKVYSQEYLNSPRESPWGTTQREQKEGLEFGRREYNIINDYCEMINIEWFVSCWDLESVEFMKPYNLKYNKIPSPLLTHIELLKTIAKQKKYTFISTGMSTIEEIQKAIWIFKDNETKYELMHCNSQYPLEDKYVNLNCIKTLRERFNCDVGYSNHSPDLVVPVYAVALGATSIEIHVTLDRSSYGSDQAASFALDGFGRAVKYIRAFEILQGDGIKRVSGKEEITKKKLRRYKDYE